MSDPTLDHPGRPGRPRKHQSDADRIRAFRSAHGLCKVTVDVPTQFAAQLRDYARQLRRWAVGFPTEPQERDDFAEVEPKRAADLSVLGMRWIRTASGYDLGQDYPKPNTNYWLAAHITKIPQRHDSERWRWHVVDNLSPRSYIATGETFSLTMAKKIVMGTVMWYLEAHSDT
jgi:hypothetical protein